jgi:uncharacterized membrane protein
MRTSRLEAFSDGVMAVAITLLVLDLAVPAREALDGRTLAHVLSTMWPNFAAFVVSFLVIGIIWVNHHGVFARVAKVDRLVLFANLFLLLVVTAIPFATRLLAEYLTAGGANAHVAAAVYSATMLVMSIAFVLLWLSVTRSQDLLAEGLDVATARASVVRFGAGLAIYAATIGLAFVSAPLTLAVHFGLAVYYCFDQLATS